MQTNLRFDHQLLAVEGEHDVHCMLELHAPDAPDTDRPPLHLALVVDRSGSMAGAKLAAAQASARFLAGRMRATDQLALVTFDDDVDLLVPLGPPDTDKLAAAIAGIEPGGCTNLSGGWLKGLEELSRADGDGTRRVLLLTDGLANEGITDPAQLRQIAGRHQGPRRDDDDRVRRGLRRGPARRDRRPTRTATPTSSRRPRTRPASSPRSSTDSRASSPRT